MTKLVVVFPSVGNAPGNGSVPDHEYACIRSSGASSTEPA